MSIYYKYNLKAIGGQLPYKWSLLSGTLPPTFILNPDGLLEGYISATGTYNLTFRVTDYAGTNVDKAITLELVDTLIITTSSLPNASSGVAYSRTLTSTGGKSPYNWVASGLPTNLSMSTSGTISGTTTQTGTYVCSIVVTDASNQTYTKNLNLTVV